ncbi:MAG TPA: glycosyltransferase [Thermoanaerobaculia bacterium]|nr:glycosyltransferase [Thermoanaerobaculia bacterium]
MTPAVSVIVPVYDNASTLRELAARIAGVLTDYEIVFVNDASPDDSAQLLATLDARVVTHERNRGQNTAVLTGFAHARGALLIVLDADLQDPPEAIPELLRRKAEAGVGIAFATRVGDYASGGRMFTSRLYKRILARLASVPQGAGLFVAIDRDVALRVAAMAPVPSIVAALGLLRVKTIAVPVARARRDGSAYSGLARLRLACRTLAWVLSHR